MAYFNKKLKCNSFESKIPKLKRIKNKEVIPDYPPQSILENYAHKKAFKNQVIPEIHFFRPKTENAIYDKINKSPSKEIYYNSFRVQSYCNVSNKEIGQYKEMKELQNNKDITGYTEFSGKELITKKNPNRNSSYVDNEKESDNYSTQGFWPIKPSKYFTNTKKFDKFFNIKNHNFNQHYSSKDLEKKSMDNCDLISIGYQINENNQQLNYLKTENCILLST